MNAWTFFERNFSKKANEQQERRGRAADNTQMREERESN